LLGKNDQVYYYEGELAPDASNFKTGSFKDIRKVIIDKKRSTDEKDFVVVIKPDNDATYKNTVDILDEMTINDVKRYAMVDISPVEYSLVQRTEQAGGVK
jgi:biopolymer transport protein ExbD